MAERQVAIQEKCPNGHIARGYAEPHAYTWLFVCGRCGWKQRVADDDEVAKLDGDFVEMLRG